MLTGAELSSDQVLDGLLRIDGRLYDDFPEIASEADARAGLIRLVGPTQISKATINELEAVAGVPILVEKALRLLNGHTYGGRKLTVSGSPICTTGFTVRHIPSGDKGVLTAGHCQDNGVTYHQSNAISYPLTWKGQFNDSRHDAQWMRELNHAVYDDFWDGDSFQDVSGQVSKSDALNDVVCHWGISSNTMVFPFGLSCGNVTSIAFDPGNLCGDSGTGNCDPVWIRVRGNNLACWLGDSGGPLFSNGNAYGILEAVGAIGTEFGECYTAVFMSRDFLPEMNLGILMT